MYSSQPKFRTIIFAFLATVALSACGTNGTVSDNTTPSSGIETQATGTASLSWTAPVDNSDGSSLALSEIGGYRIYHGTSSSNLSLVEDINDSSTTENTIVNLTNGTHYFALTVYNTSGVESAFSNVVSKVII